LLTQPGQTVLTVAEIDQKRELGQDFKRKVLEYAPQLVNQMPVRMIITGLKTSKLENQRQEALMKQSQSVQQPAKQLPAKQRKIQSPQPRQSPKAKVTPTRPSSVTKMTKSKSETQGLKQFFASKAGPRVNEDEKKRMASECSECCGMVVNGVCKYPLCTANTCIRDCNRLDASRVAARIQNKKGNISAANKEILNRRINAKCLEDPVCGKCPKVFAK